MWDKKPIKISENERFYPAIGPYRSLDSTPEFIVYDIEFYDFDKAWNYILKNSIPEDGKSIYIRRNNEWIEVWRDKDGTYFTPHF